MSVEKTKLDNCVSILTCLHNRLMIIAIRVNFFAHIVLLKVYLTAKEKDLFINS